MDEGSLLDSGVGQLDSGLGQRRTAADLAFTRLRKAIIDGELMPDERLTETRLAESLEISRTPLRNAVQRLESAGWIRRTSTGGIRVGGVCDSEIEELYDVRSSLESLALQGAIAQMTESRLANLQSNIAEQKRALDDSNLLLATDLSEAFHRGIWQICGNNVCIKFLESINDRTKRYRRIAFGGKANICQGVSEHERLVEHITSGDTEGANELLTIHIETSRNIVKAAFLNWERGTD